MATLIKQSLVFIVLFLGILLAFDAYFSKNVLFSSEYANQSKVRRLVTTNYPDEIPVFGSSKSRSAFIPDSLGPTVFNYGMDKCNFDVIEFLMEVELAKKKTSPIIIEFNHRFFVHAPDHTINTSTFTPNMDLPEVKHFLERNGRTEMRYYLPGFRYFGSYMYYLRSRFKEEGGNKKFISRGGVFVDLVPKPEVFVSFVRARLDAIEMRANLRNRMTDVTEAISSGDRNMLKYLDAYLTFTYDSTRIARFEELISQHPERPFMIVYTPQHFSEYSGIDNLGVVDELFARWEKQFTNVTTYNYCQLPLPDNCYKNSSHINLEGARRFCAVLRNASMPVLGPYRDKAPVPGGSISVQ
jgi:hypothetical protein